MTILLEYSKLKSPTQNQIATAPIGLSLKVLAKINEELEQPFIAPGSNGLLLAFVQKQ